MAVLLPAFCLLGLLAPGSPEPDDPGREIRVLTYNIHHGEGADGRIDLERIAGVILATEADVVLLQEVDVKTQRAGGVDQAKELARLTGMHSAFGANLPYAGGQYGNAILSRYPILSSQNHALPDGGAEPRGALVAEVKIPGCGVCRVLSTHWDHRSEENRLASAHAMRALVAEWTEPAILGGDLNATRDAESLKTLAKSWRLLGEGEAPTYPAADPNVQIDFIATCSSRSSVSIDLTKSVAIEEKVASDHRPFLAVLKIGASASGG
ncbi:endonuclease/exonuclease/phosphatase family protein [Alienimonas sp. DA493]|uniref:endonuclease/exonuclease/phosphatase family protein n=1 Tax=Alienimonas sp. DA493 TaxID=3373605 RepID=UPI003754F99A